MDRNLIPHKRFALRNQERGATAIDYAVILFFIALAVIVVVRSIETRSVEIFNATTDTIKDFSRVEQ